MYCIFKYMNTLAFQNNGNLNTGSGGVSPVIPSNVLLNDSNLGATVVGSIPVYTGSTLGDTVVASNIKQTNLGITISNLQIDSDVATSATTSLNSFIVNVSQVISSAFDVNVNP